MFRRKVSNNRFTMPSRVGVGGSRRCERDQRERAPQNEMIPLIARLPRKSVSAIQRTSDAPWKIAATQAASAALLFQ
jgi:hypothetical protein